jgi:hypothetical protein
MAGTTEAVEAEESVPDAAAWDDAGWASGGGKGTLAVIAKGMDTERDDDEDDGDKGIG